MHNLYDIAATEALRRQLRVDPHRVREFRTAACKRFESRERLADQFPSFTAAFSEELRITQQCDSELDGATKLLLRTEQGMLIETVILRIATGRTTLCVSSQVGCAAACDFCATGKMGVAQNLSASQIVEQVRLAGQILSQEDRRLRNVVFMGMGEPFHNEDQLYQALEILLSKQFFNLSPARILISTVGIPNAMIRCAKNFPETNLALSLHSANQEARETIIPLAKKWPLDQLRQAIEEANAIQGKPLMLEYLMLSDINDSSGDAEQLIQWTKGLDVHLNLIPFNPIDDAPHLIGSEANVIQDFAARLKAAGRTTTVRYSLGSDIAAACGQLVRRENRRLAQMNSAIEQ